MDNFNNRDLIFYQLKWIAIYFGSAFVIMILLPFRIDLIFAIPVFLLISVYGLRLLLRKLGIGYKMNAIDSDFKHIKNFVKSISSSMSDSTLYGYRVLNTIV